MNLKPLHEQTLVITGASSGIGLCTARMAAEEGANVVLASRDEDALREITDEMTGKDQQATYVVADVGNREDVEKIVQKAIDRFGGFDTWVNNAGVSIYGKLEEVPLEDHRRLFETNFWGVVHGSLAALPHLKQKGTSGGGGVLINVGSVLSERAIALQGMYSATKHAVKGFTDALRMELQREGANVAVVLVKPGAMNTPYAEHAKNFTGKKATLPPPVYDPHLVAGAILHAAEKPKTHITVGGGGKILAALGKRFPNLMDLLMTKGGMIDMQTGDEPSRGRNYHTLYNSDDGPDAQEYGEYDGYMRGTSAYTAATLHPLATSALLLGAAAIAAIGLPYLFGKSPRDFVPEMPDLPEGADPREWFGSEEQPRRERDNPPQHEPPYKTGTVGVTVIRPVVPRPPLSPAPGTSYPQHAPDKLGHR